MLDGFWYIAAESRLVRPGRLTATALANQVIVLVRNRSGTVQALEDRCSHRGVPLSSGRLDQLAGLSNLQHPVPEKVTLRWVT